MRKRLAAFFAVVLMAALSTQLVAADGTEQLGTPSIPIADGTDVITAGTGLFDQPGTIDITIPAGASVEQVLLYWEGQFINSSDDTITIEGNSVTGTSIGGPTVFFNDVKSETFRADITDLGLVGVGANSLSVTDMAFDFADHGAGLLVIVDDGESRVIELRDGNDLAWIGFAQPLDRTEVQTFTFDAEDADRTATLDMFFSSVAGTKSQWGFRPSRVATESGGIVTFHDNLLDSHDGEEWDTLELDVTVPAGATELLVQAFSLDDGTDRRPASFAWNAAAMTLPVTPPPDDPPVCVPDDDDDDDKKKRKKGKYSKWAKYLKKANGDDDDDRNRWWVRFNRGGDDDDDDDKKRKKGKKGKRGDRDDDDCEDEDEDDPGDKECKRGDDDDDDDDKKRRHRGGDRDDCEHDDDDEDDEDEDDEDEDEDDEDDEDEDDDDDEDDD